MPAPHIEENVLDRYAMGTLPGESIPKVEEHLLDCFFCQSRLVQTDEFLVYFRAAATQLDLRPVPLWQRLLNALLSKRCLHVSQARRWWPLG